RRAKAAREFVEADQESAAAGVVFALDHRIARGAVGAYGDHVVQEGRNDAIRGDRGAAAVAGGRFAEGALQLLDAHGRAGRGFTAHVRSPAAACTADASPRCSTPGALASLCPWRASSSRPHRPPIASPTF